MSYIDRAMAIALRLIMTQHGRTVIGWGAKFVLFPNAPGVDGPWAFITADYARALSHLKPVPRQAA